MLDLKKMEQELDDSLPKETSETLNKWLSEKRKGYANTSEIVLEWQNFHLNSFDVVELHYRNILVGFIEYNRSEKYTNAKNHICILEIPNSSAKRKSSIAIQGRYIEISDSRAIWNNMRKNKSFLKRKVKKSKITNRIDNFLEMIYNRVDATDNKKDCIDYIT